MKCDVLHCNQKFDIFKIQINDKWNIVNHVPKVPDNSFLIFNSVRAVHISMLPDVYVP